MTAATPARPERAILVLGAAVWPGGRPSTTMARRTQEAARQWHAGAASAIIPCGGVGRHPPSEAEVMTRLLVEAGVPEEVIHPEDGSTSTATNIALARPILEELGISHVLIVSDAYHLPRARLLARRAGLGGRTASPPLCGARPATFARGVLREIPAYLAACLGLERR
jgi:uncharacterized SAM-binding protein YcdF (DUF218 family)